MKTYVAADADGVAIGYTDKKRWLWLASLLYPLQPFIGIALHARTGNELWLLLPLLLNYVIAPLLDWLIGEDENNPPEEVVMQLDQDRYYRWLTWLVVPLHFLTLAVTAWYAATASLSPFGFAGLAAIAGMVAGLAINTGHELGHKNSKLEKTLSKWVLAVPAYGHFSIEHNRGHHRDVATAEDPASARMGESIYRFALREIPGAFARAWEQERERLNLRGKPVWHRDNQILQSFGLSLAIAVVLLIAFGPLMLPFLLIHHALAYWQLTSANYIEHYGLRRVRDKNGKLERCRPHHSWNSNHILSNLVLFHLERHSDHHTHPLRRYQSLRHFPNLPTLPNGYFGMYLLAYLPPLWFRVMDRRLLALPHIQGDLERINIAPEARARITQRYGSSTS
ncbi:MAG: alkane 1-monooxygenase [Pseudomonadota bacterium]